MDRQPDELRKELRELVKEADRRPAKLAKEKNRMRGKNKIGKKLKRRQQNVIDQKMLALREEMEATRKQSQKEKEGHRQERMVAATAPALQRFFKNNK